MGIGSYLAKRALIYTASSLILGPLGGPVIGEAIAEFTDEL